MALDFTQYQRRALGTDRAPFSTGQSEVERDRALMVPLLGLAGEAGSILTEYKKWLREHESYAVFDDRIAEELGDVLWYVSNLASKAGLSLNEIATRNLRKTKDRWRDQDGAGGLNNQPLFDDGYPEGEQIPRQFEAELREVVTNGRRQVRVLVNGRSCGEPLTDNSHTEDGYRFHDVFHLAFAAVLGWSPITRRNLKRKRKSNARIDEIEDGARAAIAEEAVSLIAFDYARAHSFLHGVDRVDYTMLATARTLTNHFEVRRASLADWERALLDGYEAWRQIRRGHGGRVRGDLASRTFEYVKPPTRKGRSGSTPKT